MTKLRLRRAVDILVKKSWQFLRDFGGPATNVLHFNLMPVALSMHMSGKGNPADPRFSEKVAHSRLA